MASDPEPTDGTWSELEQGFFEAAPPETPVPPPAPMRFDDLDPVPEPGRARSATSEKWRGRATRAWAATAPARSRLVTAASGTRGALMKAASATRRGLSTATSATRTTLRLLSVAAIREGRPRVERLATSLRNVLLDRRTITAAVATLILVTGVSAVVVAARNGGARPTLTAAAIVPRPTSTPAPASSMEGPIMSEPPGEAPTAPPCEAPATDPVPTAQSIAPATVKPPHAVRKTTARPRAAAPARPAVQKQPVAGKPTVPAGKATSLPAPAPVRPAR